MTIDWMDIAVTLLTTGVFALIGFVWRWSHKLTALEKDVADNKRRIRKMESEHGKVLDKMYSIVKSRGDFKIR
tara:strand:+ start:277 stop:495 length:219 start_codon:yes stop_codon:yes gene_type:complete